MKTARMWRLALAATATMLFCFRGPAAERVIRIRPEVDVSDVRRFGINLGFRTSWGAEQLISNVLMNPGFEGIVDRCLVSAIPLDRYRFLEQSDWLGRSDQFWVGAEFQVRTGISAGYTGRLAGSRMSGAQGLPEFTSSEPLPSLQPGDRISLTKLSDDRLPTQWWIPADSATQVSISLEPRPGSAGQRSLRLRSRPNSTVEIHSYLDAIGDRAGALLPITGKWRLYFWTRGRAASSLAVTFGRSGGHTWVDRTVAVSPRWQRIVIDFEGGEDADSGILDLRFRTSGEILLDDVWLGSVELRQGAFRQEVIDVLANLHPAYLRDWQGQLGDTLDNRLAPAEARRASRYRPGGDDATDFQYSLPEFLDLCRQVHANPWIVAPTTFSDAEWAGLGRYLLARSAADRFSEILVEFGNENWNGIFAAAGITDGTRHAEAASRGFHSLAEAAGALPIKAVLNAQYANPDAVTDLSGRIPYPAVIAVAPYFLTELRAAQTAGSALSAMFAGDGGKLQQISRGVRSHQHELGVYEINLHTTDGDAPPASRASIVAGAASASALATHLLDGLALGVRRQCAYVLSGFDFKLPDPLGHAPLWGVARDLGPTRRLRPTGLALVLLNQAVAGDLHRITNPLRDLTVAPFRFRSAWSVAVASAAAVPREVTLEFPEIPGVSLPTRCLTLKASDPLATNEETERVAIAQETMVAAGRVITLRLPAYGLAVLLPEESHGK